MLCAWYAIRSTAQEEDMKWLSTLFMCKKAMAWPDFNNRNDETEYAHKMSTSTYMCGPFIDANDSHPDTVPTSMGQKHVFFCHHMFIKT